VTEERRRALPDESATNPPNLTDAAEMLWVVLANVSGGDWTKQSQEWQEAAARWRDYYFAALKGTEAARAVEPPQESDADDLLTVAHAILKGVYPAGKLTPNIRAICRHYIELRAALVPPRDERLTAPQRLRAENEALLTLLSDYWHRFGAFPGIEPFLMRLK
jgi:hypothetical protein